MNAAVRFIVAGLLAGLTAVPALAQAMRYPVKTMDFDIWCTEEQHIAWERCDKRLPEDMQKFEAYRAIVERYEIPYYKQKDATLRFDEDILNNDPVDKKPDSTLKHPPPINAGP
jgi:hypothetical protein